jgi:chromosome segregation ATPase
MADADFPSNYDRDMLRHERAVDEHRRREELEAEVVRLRAESADRQVRLAQCCGDLGAEMSQRAMARAENAQLKAEVARLAADLAWYRGRAHRAESIVVRLAVTLSRYSGFDPGALIEAHAPENAGPSTPPRDDG